jgi:hypothetical protein
MKMLLVLCAVLAVAGCKSDNVVAKDELVRRDFVTTCLDGVQYWTRRISAGATYFAPRFNQQSQVVTCNN